MRFIGLFLLLAAALSAAGLPGTWIITSHDEGGRPTKGELIIDDNNGAFSARLMLLNGAEIPLEKVRREGDSLSFQFLYRDMTVRVALALDGDKLKGKWETPTGEAAPVLCVRKAEADGGVAGKWTVTATTSSGMIIKGVLEMKEENSKLSGVLNLDQGSVPLSDIVVAGGSFTFRLLSDNDPYSVSLERNDAGYAGTYSASNGRNGKVVLARE